ncbi:hypothetical protein [Klenkia brasiliensis]|uniref:hypothetical protein n=1 Tax=Klenkia brasiliensis TaxID=333142 RepID=UPI000B870790|nr:hypothetical protein [Klenkia brasiliensis]
MELEDDGTLAVRGPGGEPLERVAQLTCREARPWVRRSSTLLGVQLCGSPVDWVVGDGRAEVAERIRRAEGTDCDTAGDIRHLRLPDGRRAVVLVVE